VDVVGVQPVLLEVHGASLRPQVSLTV